MLPVVAVVTSVEGTTTPLSFIRQVLFPFARQRMAGFLAAHATHPEVIAQLAEVRRLVPGHAELDTLLRWTDQDAKITPLKVLQGLIWREGYEAGQLAGAVYPDVPPALRRWAAAGLGLYGFSAGSAEAQRAIFRHCGAGDLSGLFGGFFDTRIGRKREPQSFSRLAIGLQRPPAEIVYLSDDEAELDAAATAGMRTCQLVRRDSGTKASRQHPRAASFAAVTRRMGLVPSGVSAMALHRLPATPDTVSWGILGAHIPPALTVELRRHRGARMRLRRPRRHAAAGLGLRHPRRRSGRSTTRVPRGPAHIVTGPVAIAGAEPGDMLEVRVEKIELGADWGYCGFRPLAGTLPEDFPERFLSHIPVDRARGTCRLPYGVELKLAPFFGVMGVAPPADLRRRLLRPAARARRQHRQQGTRRGRHPLPAGLGPGRAVLGRRRPRRAGRRRGLRQRAGDLPHRHLHLHPAQDGRPGAADPLPPRGDRHPPHHHGLQPRPRPGHEAGAARDDRPDPRAHRTDPPGGLPVLLAGGGFPRHPDRQRQPGGARHAAQGLAVLTP